MKDIINNLFIAAMLFVASFQTHAQDTVVQASADEAGLAPVPATALSRAGTFWVITAGPNGNLTALPYPGLLPNLSALPVYSVNANTFLVDDTGGQVAFHSMGARMSSAMMTSTLQAQADTVAGLIDQIQFNSLYPSGGDGNTNGGFQPNNTSPVYTNGLWLEVQNEGTNVLVILHNTSDDQLYQLISATNLLSTNWDIGDLQWGEWDSDQTWFWPIAKVAPATFYRAHQASAIMQVWNIQDSKEPNPTNNDAGQTGIVGFQNGVDTPSTNDITVYYTISGTAQNGIDYSNLPGVLTLAAGMLDTNIIIQPTAMGLQPDKTIVLTLVQNASYLIDPGYTSTINTLFANPETYPTARGDTEFPCPNTSWPIYLQGHDNLGLPLTCTIQTWPTHGTLDTNDLPSVTYTATNCYEGQDSFTFTVSDGQHTSRPTNVTLIVSSQVYANPVSAQTCRGSQVSVALDGGVYCNAPFSFALLSSPLYGTLDTNGMPYNMNYTPTGTNFTGTDSFNYRVTDECGYSATGTVSIVVGDTDIIPNSQTVMVGTNQPAAITLSVADGDSCIEAGNYTYTIISGPTNGTLDNTQPIVTYTPNHEGVDSFQFNVSDGVWAATNSGTVTIYDVGGPILMTECDPFGTAVRLNWVLDPTVQQMQQKNNFISDYKVYRSAVSGGNYTCIHTNTDITQMSYLDTNVVAGQTNYYEVTFEFINYYSGKTYESPRSDEIVAGGHYPDDLIAPDATWGVWDVTTNQPRAWKGFLQTPFSSAYPQQYKTLYPLPNTIWPLGTTWSNHITLVIPTNVVDLSQVKYSIAIDNDFWLYLNNSTNYIDTTSHEFEATWSSFQSFENVASGLLHLGTNDIVLVIRDRGGDDYFSMVVTTNTCGW